MRCSRRPNATASTPPSPSVSLSRVRATSSPDSAAGQRPRRAAILETLQCCEMENADVRRRVRAALEAARREDGERRERSDEAARDYASFLTDRAVPIFRQVAAALASEGRRFQVSTPADSVRLSAEGAADDFIELTLDTSQDPPRVLGRTNCGRGRRAVTAER